MNAQDLLVEALTTRMSSLDDRLKALEDVYEQQLTDFCSKLTARVLSELTTHKTTLTGELSAHKALLDDTLNSIVSEERNSLTVRLDTLESSLTSLSALQASMASVSTSLAALLEKSETW